MSSSHNPTVHSNVSLQVQNELSNLSVGMRTAQAPQSIFHEAAEPPPPVPAVAERTSEMKDVLEDLRAEPEEDETRVAKFGLFEKYTEAVSTSRDKLLELWGQCQDSFAPAPRQSLTKVVRSLDDPTYTGLPDDVFANPRVWFVHHCMKQAIKNCAHMEAIQLDFDRKLN
eukprot:402230_1